MRKAFIIGPSFFYFNQSIAQAFRDLGYEVQISQFDEPVHPFNLHNKILRKLSVNQQKLYDKGQKLYNQEVRAQFDSFRPDIVFIYNGDLLTTDTADYFRQTAKVGIWELDGIYRHPRGEALATHVDAFFCFEPDDVEYLKKKGITSYFLPQACDTRIYHPLSLQKDIDILFIGALYGYPKRIRLLKDLVRRFPQYHIEIYGIYKPWFKNPLQWLFREKRDIFKNRNVAPKEVNTLYNRAKLCINIHHEQSKNGANPKVFEISGSGAFQLVDSNPYIESLFPDGGVAFYHDEEEFFANIEQILSDNTYQKTEKAYQRIINYHTFTARIKEALTRL